MAVQVNIEQGWKEVLKAEFSQPYFAKLVQFLKEEKAAGKIIYPEGKNIFNAFAQSTWQDTKVVIIGQDPYHGAGQAHGLSFSVQQGTAIPPSLQNIYKELHDDLNCTLPSHGNLSHWARQGVLLLNASLTVENAKPMSHSKIGWAHFTDAVIKQLSQQKTHVVFLLWGSFAQKKATLIDEQKHLILQSAHPSPLSAYTGFYGSKHFSKSNTYLAANALAPIDWQVM